jgi:hypothetical protein
MDKKFNLVLSNFGINIDQYIRLSEDLINDIDEWRCLNNFLQTRYKMYDKQSSHFTNNKVYRENIANKMRDQLEEENADFELRLLSISSKIRTKLKK